VIRQWCPSEWCSLVHGAFADAFGLAPGSRTSGYPVLAPANPLRNVGSGVAYVASALKLISARILLLATSSSGAAR